ncbi:unnamed protein product [Lepeophtheirus salmonis]|uniref:(salmon louse) hypothetical protein n=1 Tax=Lepeophtheirus salmonis TaxID=72036 RepID=A0A7R8CKZ3_LEPSM|nr:unnamed protein product [Lepeophtheirus salmonis]CAF2850241.1 unnamed protein product [Lepeophtheirus salmonis]
MVPMGTNKNITTSTIFRLGNSLTVEDGMLTGFLVPICRQRLRYLMWHVQKKSSDRIKEISKLEKHCHHRLTYTNTPALILHDILKRSSVVSVGTHLNHTQQAALTKGVIEESGSDTSCKAKSYSAADKARRTTKMLLPGK